MFVAAALTGTLLWSAHLAQVHLEARASVLDRLESSLVDVRVLAFGRRAPPKGVVVVAIDDATIDLAGRFPIPRDTMGKLVAGLQAQGAAAVILDLLFLDPGTPQGNDDLAKALAAGPTAIAASVLFPRDAPRPDGALQGGATCELPIAAFRRASSIGAVNIALDRSGIARDVPMLMACGSGLLPALPLKAVSLAAKDEPGFDPDAVTVGTVVSPLDVGRNLVLRYYGPEGTITTLSAAAVLKGMARSDSLQGSVAIIGATAAGVGDRYPTPFDSVTPGVEILATAIGNLETGTPLVRTTTIRRIDAGVALALALSGVGAVLIDNVGLGLLAFAALVALWLGGAVLGFAQGYWFAMAMPFAATAPEMLLTGGARLALDRLTARRLRREQATLAAFQSPAMRARLAADPNFLSQPVERDIAVVFVDLSGFTGLSERLDPLVLRELIKDWHEIVEEAAADTRGVVALYMADGAMLVWGMAGHEPDAAGRAVRAALRLEADTMAWLAEVEPRTGPLGVKIGGHFGPAILSRLGHATHQHITAIGDTVNVASRLMEVAVEHGSTIALGAQLLGDARQQGLRPTDGTFDAPIEAKIRGREQPLPVSIWRRAPDAG